MSAPAAKLSNYIGLFDSISPDQPVLMYCRVSTPTQLKDGALERQRSILRAELEAKGARIIEEHLHCTPGYDLDPEEWQPGYTAHWKVTLRKAGKLARKKRAWIAITDPTRIVRHPIVRYGPPYFDRQARVCDCEKMQRYIGRVTIVSLAAPDLSPREIRKFQSLQGQTAAGGNKGGRKAKGHKRKVRKKKKPKARRLRRKGYSLGRIAEMLHVPRGTIQSWTQDIKVKKPLYEKAKSAV